MNWFIYVFSDEDRNVLLSMQYELLKSDDANHIHVFVNKRKQSFSCDGVRYVLADTLTF